MNECEHDWNGTSKLRIVVSEERDLFASIIPVAPTLCPIEFCRICGTLRLSAEMLAAIAVAETKLHA